MPVFPLVASITVGPGLSRPLRSASSITPRARRSLTEPNGLKASTLTNKFTSGGASLLILTTGVFPTVSRMLAYLCPIVGPPGVRIVHSRSAQPDAPECKSAKVDPVPLRASSGYLLKFGAECHGKGRDSHDLRIHRIRSSALGPEELRQLRAREG